MDYETFATTADVGIRAFGDDWASLYRNAVLGCGELIFGPQPAAAGTSAAASAAKRLRITGDSGENVLVKLLGEVMHLVYQKRRCVVGLRVRHADERGLAAEILHAPWPQPPALEIKSVTYHDLKVREEAGRKRVDLLLDV